MLYPQTLKEFGNGFSMYIPDPVIVKSVYEQLLQKDPATPFPFWAKIWPSALAMLSFLKMEPEWIDGKAVLEIGAGIGLPSLAMAKQASSILISDYSAEAVALIEKNIQYLQLKNAQAICLDWNHFPADIHAELILLSDVNYAPGQFDSLLALIKELIAKGSTLLLSSPQRISTTRFAEAVQPFVTRTILQTVKADGANVEVCILVLSNKK